MNIITTDQLAVTLLQEVLQSLHNMYRQAHSGEGLEDITSFDDYLWNNQQALGHSLYQVIGDRYGDADSCVEEIL